MREIDPRKLLQRANELYLRRWFSDERHDLYVWVNESGKVMRFQFCYDRGTRREQVVQWRRGGTIEHALIDDGETLRGKQTPVLVSNGLWDLRDPLNRLRENREGIDPRLYEQLMEIFESCTLQVSI